MGLHMATEGVTQRLSVFVCHKWAIKIVPSPICTCSNVLAYGLLSPLFVILLLLLRHHFHGVRQTALCPGRKGMSLRQGPTFLLLFCVPQDVQPPSWWLG